MSEEKESVVISPYVYAGIRPVDLPDNFLRNVKVSVINYSVSHVLQGIERYTSISDEQLSSRCRKGPLCDARHMYCNILRQKMDYSLIDIGRSIKRDHTTVMNSIKKHNGLYDTDQKYRAIYDRVDRYVDIMSSSDDNEQ